MLADKAKKVIWALMRSGRPLRLVRNGCAPAIEHLNVLRGKSLGTILDVGANVGQFASVARALHPKAQLLTFEPLPAAVAKLRRIFAGDSAVHIYPYALSTQPGKLKLHISRRSDSSSLLPIGTRQIRENSGTDEVGHIDVEVRRLDEIVDAAQLKPEALLKIDVQGAEMDVLAGAIRLLPSIEWIYSEISFVELYDGQPLATEVFRKLFDYGYEINQVSSLSRGSGGDVIQADVLFRRIK